MSIHCAVHLKIILYVNYTSIKKAEKKKFDSQSHQKDAVKRTSPRSGTSNTGLKTQFCHSYVPSNQSKLFTPKLPHSKKGNNYLLHTIQ